MNIFDSFHFDKNHFFLHSKSRSQSIIMNMYMYVYISIDIRNKLWKSHFKITGIFSGNIKKGEHGWDALSHSWYCLFPFFVYDSINNGMWRILVLLMNSYTRFVIKQMLKNGLFYGRKYLKSFAIPHFLRKGIGFCHSVSYIKGLVRKFPKNLSLFTMSNSLW